MIQAPLDRSTWWPLALSILVQHFDGLSRSDRADAAILMHDLVKAETGEDRDAALGRLEHLIVGGTPKRIV